MNKQQLVKAMADSSDMTQTDAHYALDVALEAISAALAAGDEVKLVGFGSFKTTLQAARIARNPKSGAEVHVPAKNRVGFVAGKGLKSAVNL